VPIGGEFNVPIDRLSKALAEQLPLALDYASPPGKLPG